MSWLKHSSLQLVTKFVCENCPSSIAYFLSLLQNFNFPLIEKNIWLTSVTLLKSKLEISNDINLLH